jgi:hypothetical protein
MQGEEITPTYAAVALRTIAEAIEDKGIPKSLVWMRRIPSLVN